MAEHKPKAPRKRRSVTIAELEAMRTERDDALEELDKISADLENVTRARESYLVANDKLRDELESVRAEFKSVSDRFRHLRREADVWKTLARKECAIADDLRDKQRRQSRTLEILTRAARLGDRMAGMVQILGLRNGSDDVAKIGADALESFRGWFELELDVRGAFPAPADTVSIDEAERDLDTQAAVVNAKDGEPRSQQ